jgi:hypothetical protein
MPYIEQQHRAGLDPTKRIAFERAVTTGELNFQITRLVDDWIKGQGLTYTALNSAVGALECAKAELLRRVAAPYEDSKIKQNGEVYEIATK